MSDNARAALIPYCQGKPGEALVFNRGGILDEPICGTSLYRRYKSAITSAGLPELRFHDLRHSFGSLAIQIFTPIEVMDFMGHSDLKTTQRYLHVKQDPEAAAKLSSLFVSDQLVAENVVGIGRNKGGRPAVHPGGCPKCGGPKAPGQAYCAEHRREYRQQLRDLGHHR